MRRRDDYRITGPQEAYLRLLLDQAFAKRLQHGVNLDRHHLNGISKQEANAAITELKRLLAPKVAE